MAHCRLCASRPGRPISPHAPTRLLGAPQPCCLPPPTSTMQLTNSCADHSRLPLLISPACICMHALRRADKIQCYTPFHNKQRKLGYLALVMFPFGIPGTSHCFSLSPQLGALPMPIARRLPSPGGLVRHLPSSAASPCGRVRAKLRAYAADRIQALGLACSVDYRPDAGVRDAKRCQQEDSQRLVPGGARPIPVAITP